MELLLKNGKATIIGKGYIPKEDLKLNIKGVDKDLNLFAKINNLPKHKVKNRVLVIPKELLEDGLLITITVSNEKETFKETYRSDKINLEEAILIGEDPVECFPASLIELRTTQNNLVKDLYKVVKRLEKVEEEIKNINERGDLL